MSNDWQRFVALMAAAGWRQSRVTTDEGGVSVTRSIFRHDNGREYKPQEDWREWLAAGQTPPPF